MNPIKSSRSSIVSAIITVAVVTALTVFADLFLPFKDYLKAAFTHHWVGKGVIAAISFVVIYALALASASGDKEENLPVFLKILSWTAILGTVIIFGFFLYETMH